MTKGVVYYSQLSKDKEMTRICQEHIKNSGLKIVSVTDIPCDFGENIVYESGGGSFEEMFEKILIGLKALDTDVVFLCEDDVIYAKEHFDFDPPSEDIFYYNGNYWFLRMKDGFAIHYNVSPLSGLVANRQALITHFEERIEYIKENGFSRRIGFEPMTHRRIKWKNWYNFEIFMPQRPNLDIALDNNTWKRWKISEFRRKPTFWEESTIYNIPGWPNLPEIVAPFSKIEEKTLTIVIPARNEMFIGRTIQNILENIEGKTDIIAVLDGYETEIPEIPNDPRVKVIKLNESVGQREASNMAVRLSNSKYIAKTDAHCAFDKGFDRILMEDMQDDVTMVPVMRNLWAFDWKCRNCGKSEYQSPTPGTKGSKLPAQCPECGMEDWFMDIKWIGKESPQSTSYCFDSEPHFQYFGEYKKRDEYKKALENGHLTESMSLQGSFFMLTRDKWWKLNISDNDTFGNWGSQGIEVAVKTWLSGGRVLCNHRTWYAHLFRTQGGNFGFPYKLSGNQVQNAKKKAKELFFTNSWIGQKRPLKWLLKKFYPVPGWTDEEIESLPEL